MMGNMPMQLTVKRLRLAAVAMLTVMLYAVAVAPAMSQEISPDQLALARKYIDLTDQSGVYEATVVQAGVNTYKQLLPQNPKIAEPLNLAIEAVLTEYKGKKSELFDQIARLYAQTFSKDELQTIVDFYGSPAGQKLAKANAELNSTVQRIMNVYSLNLNQEFFRRVRAELKAKGIDT